ncbi:MAG: DUF4292 domain-containing protein, partial [Proteobacteria bacterium]|nr:DUF4292 domain-containing protein [Pseudomonadota bacterium]
MKRRLKRSRSFSIDLAAAVLAFSILAGACASLPPGSGAPLPGAAALVEHLREEQGRFTGFAGQGRIDLKDDRSQYHFKAMVAAVRPDRLRIQAIDVMGRPVLTLTVHGDTLQFLDYREEKMYQGKATRRNLNRFLPLGLDTADVITLLSGGQPLRSHDRAIVERDSGPGPAYWILNLVQGEG